MDFHERMARGRDAAAAKRHRGISTGKAAKGWGPRKPAPIDHDCPHVRREKIAVAWHLAKSAALEIYERAVFPERYGAGSLDDAVTARIAAELDAIPF
jgi:hypothetical protein